MKPEKCEYCDARAAWRATPGCECSTRKTHLACSKHLARAVKAATLHRHGAWDEVKVREIRI